MKLFFGVVFALVAALLVGFQIVSVNTSGLPFGLFVLLGLLTWCSAFAAVSILGMRSRIIAVWAALLALLTTLYLVGLVAGDLEGTKTVAGTTYFFFLVYTVGFSVVGVAALQEGG